MVYNIKLLMKKVLLIFILFGPGIYVYAQKVVLSVAGGPAIYSGDLQLGNFTVKLSNEAFGAAVGYKINPHILVSANLMLANISASDSNVTNAPFKQRRNLSFHTDIQEFTVQLQYDIFAITRAHQFAPYVFAGAGFFHFNPWAYDRNGKKTFLQPLGTEGEGLPQYPDRKIYSLTQATIPFGVGIKYSLSENITVGAELSFRKIFTDYLDDVSTRYPDSLTLLNARGPEAVDLSFRGDEVKPPSLFPTGGVRGNPNKKDTYRFILLRICWTLPNVNFGSGGSGFSSRSRKQTGCPRKVL